MFEQCLYFNTTSLARRLEREWTNAFKPFGLTPSQAFMLRVVLAKGSITSTDISFELNISKATCSRTVDGLVGLGFVERMQVDKDARSHELVPTQQAKTIHAALNQASGDVTKRLKQIIGREEFETTVRNLRGISSSIR
jgi:DNA-binding MarR family transcriptional regulator